MKLLLINGHATHLQAATFPEEHARNRNRGGRKGETKMAAQSDASPPRGNPARVDADW
jgi:hypothetical protein